MMQFLRARVGMLSETDFSARHLVTLVLLSFVCMFVVILGSH